jgi:hypothetical protein
MMTLAEASKIARRTRSPSRAAELIVEKAYYRGMAKYERLKDDTTYDAHAAARSTRPARFSDGHRSLNTSMLWTLHRLTVCAICPVSARVRVVSHRCLVVDLNPSQMDFVKLPGASGGCCQLM